MNVVFLPSPVHIVPSERIIFSFIAISGMENFSIQGHVSLITIYVKIVTNIDGLINIYIQREIVIT